ncbi:MAG TPA: GNAT family N-acetyltransferase [Candidatus Dojkabacteria bacterium]|jgi:ribosomal protein S18 acetylase RimI-like enzyme
MNYQIRTADYNEIDIIIEWAAEEGWNPGLYDKKSFYAADNSGFLIGFLDEKPIASISSIAYDDKFGFLGFYIVKPEFRNRGYGIRLWREALKKLPTQNIGLDGVLTQQENYKKSGFKLAYRNIRYEGSGIKNNSKNKKIILLSELPFKTLSKYDSRFFPANRDTFLKEWITQEESLAAAFINEGMIEGYGVIRKCREGFKIGPLFSNNFNVAENLYTELSSFAGENNKIFIDIPETNRDGIKLAEHYSMRAIFETARMYTKLEPEVDLNGIYGVTSFELG